MKTISILMKLLVICQNLAFDIDKQKIKLKIYKRKQINKRNTNENYLLVLRIRFTLFTKDKIINIQKIKFKYTKDTKFKA